MLPPVKFYTIALSIASFAFGTMSGRAVPLDMANNSVDDQYINCSEVLDNNIHNEILQSELNKNENFSNLWNKYKESDESIRIIKVYTSDSFYAAFNKAVSKERKTYKNRFQYKAAHFLLTRAVQKYKVKKCTEVFRRSKEEFRPSVLGGEMRFGRFASASTKQDRFEFGNTSCFIIYTCEGANITSFSVQPDEKEVLIPPYEKFKFLKVTAELRSKYKQMKCNDLYRLNNTGKFSSMNCELDNQKRMCRY